MRRRDLLTSTAASTLLPWRATAQQRRLVALLWLDRTELTQLSDGALRRGLAEAGFGEGEGLAFAARYADGDLTRLPALAAELAALKPDVIVAAGSIAALAAHRAAPEVPVIAILDGDPVPLGLFHSYARPEAMVTGLTLSPANSVIAKNLEILRDLVPTLRGIGFMFSPDVPGAVQSEPEVGDAVGRLGLAYIAFPVRSMDEVKAAFLSGAGGGRGMYIYGSPLLRGNLGAFVDMAIAARTPVMTLFRGFTERGFLVSNGPDLWEMWRRLGGYAAKILIGVKPGDLPVEMPAKFTLVINLKTAAALGLSVPQSLLARADEVIE